MQNRDEFETIRAGNRRLRAAVKNPEDGISRGESPIRARSTRIVDTALADLDVADALTADRPDRAAAVRAVASRLPTPRSRSWWNGWGWGIPSLHRRSAAVWRFPVDRAVGEQGFAMSRRKGHRGSAELPRYRLRSETRYLLSLSKPR